MLRELAGKSKGIKLFKKAMDKWQAGGLGDALQSWRTNMSPPSESYTGAAEVQLGETAAHSCEQSGDGELRGARWLRMAQEGHGDVMAKYKDEFELFVRTAPESNPQDRRQIQKDLGRTFSGEDWANNAFQTE